MLKGFKLILEVFSPISIINLHAAFAGTINRKQNMKILRKNFINIFKLF
tara:strand:+ start:445 stop:591 length:147 start_codon:yes stop_codon:yes gene_type:complete